MYLYGYTIEMRFKAAYYRLTAVPSGWDITQRMPGAPDSPRDTAENTIRATLGLHRRAAVGHNLVGWAGLVIETRRFHALGQFDPPFEAALSNHAQAAAAQWREVLRYRANNPYTYESAAVADAARWVRLNYRALWS